MKRKQSLAIAVALAVSVGSLYEAARLRRVNSRARFELIEVKRKTAAIESEIRTHHPAKPPSNATSASPVSPPPKLPTSKPVKAKQPDTSRLIATHPEVRALFATAFQVRFDRDYHALFQQLALSPEQQQRFKQRLFEDKMNDLDLQGTAEALGSSRNDPAAQALRQQQQETLQGDLEEILGAKGYRVFADLRRANGVRGFVDNLATSMMFSGHPMNLEQTNRLVQVMADASEHYQKGGDAMPWDTDWDRIMAQTPAFLNEAQLGTLRADGEQRVHFAWLLPKFYAQRDAPAK